VLSGVYIMADESKLSQVMRNLLSNAIKFTPAGGSVSISAVVIEDVINRNSNCGSKRFLRVEVTDSGVGISKVKNS
jgi:signal transduction histidine kinase